MIKNVKKNFRLFEETIRNVKQSGTKVIKYAKKLSKKWNEKLISQNESEKRRLFFIRRKTTNFI
jgi:hypothetical protein